MLNHELEHARRGEDCSGNFHPHSHDAQGIYVDFEGCACSFAKQACQMGLINAWSHMLKDLVFPSEEELAALEKLEKQHGSSLAAFLQINESKNPSKQK